MKPFNNMDIRMYYMNVLEDLNTGLYYSGSKIGFTSLGDDTLFFKTNDEACGYIDTAIEHVLHKKFLEYCKLENITPKYEDEVKYQKLRRNDYKLIPKNINIEVTNEQE